MNIKRGIAQYKAHWLAQLNEIEQLINEGILPKSFGEEVSQLCNSISSFRFKVPLIGKFSVGKSTLLNTWLGQDIQKVDLAPCTAMATEFHYAEAGQEKIVICWIDDPKTGSIRREALPLSAYPACMDRWQSSPPPLRYSPIY